MRSLYERAAHMQVLIRDLCPPQGPDFWALPRSTRDRILEALEPLPSGQATGGKYPPGFVHDPAPGDIVTDTGTPRDVGGRHI